MMSLIQLLQFKRTRSDRANRTTDAAGAKHVDPEEQLDLLFRDVQREPESIKAEQWEEKAIAFEARLQSLAASPATNDAARSHPSRLAWSGAAGPKLAALGVGVAAVVGLAVTPASDVVQSSSDSSSLVAPQLDQAHDTYERKLLLINTLQATSARGAPDSAKKTTDANVSPSPIETAYKDSERDTGRGTAEGDSENTSASRARVSKRRGADRGSGKAHVPAKSKTSRPQHQKLSEKLPATKPSPTTAKPVQKDTFAASLRALKAAEQALRQGKTEHARSMLARRFSPELAPHATALRAVLACQSGNLERGKRLILAQGKRHPNSPYLRRMRAACGTAN